MEFARFLEDNVEAEDTLYSEFTQIPPVTSPPPSATILMRAARYHLEEQMLLLVSVRSRRFRKKAGKAWFVLCL